MEEVKTVAGVPTVEGIPYSGINYLQSVPQRRQPQVQPGVDRSRVSQRVLHRHQIIQTSTATVSTSVVHRHTVSRT